MCENDWYLATPLTNRSMVILRISIAWQFIKRATQSLLPITTETSVAGMLLLARERCLAERSVINISLLWLFDFRVTALKSPHWLMIISTVLSQLDSTIKSASLHWSKSLFNDLCFNLFNSEKNLDSHDVDLKDQPIGLALEGNSNPVVITPDSAITVNVSCFCISYSGAFIF